MCIDVTLLKMLQISDNLFPIGGFTQSNGLETFIQKDKITTASDLSEYMKNFVQLITYNELMALRYGYEFAEDSEKLCKYDNLYSAYRAPYEIRLGSEKLNTRFIKVLEKITDYPLLQNYKQLIQKGLCYGNHPFGVGIYIKENDIDINLGMLCYCYSLTATTITNAVKIIPLSQNDGQIILAKSFDDILQAVQHALSANEEDFGLNGSQTDIYAMNHETLYSRLYMN